MQREQAKREKAKKELHAGGVKKKVHGAGECEASERKIVSKTKRKKRGWESSRGRHPTARKRGLGGKGVLSKKKVKARSPAKES